MKRKTKFLILITILLLFLGCLYLYYGNNNLQVSNYIIESDRLPETFKDFKIVHVSDFHNIKSKEVTSDLIKQIKDNNPNIIVLTGDLIDANKIDIDTSIKFIKKINNVAPIYYVTGNHEASISNYENLKEQLISNKVIVLDNKMESIKMGDSTINILGIDDPQFVSNSYIKDSDKIKDELKLIEFDENEFNILLTHRPELFDIYVEYKFDLVLAGHAHGGQIRIPFIGGLVAPNQGLLPKYTSGLYEKNNTKMIVSRGIGNSVLPFRINNRPELVVIEFNNN